MKRTNYPPHKKLAIMQLITGLGVGGAERVVMELAEYLQTMGIHTIVVALDTKKKLLAQYPNTTLPIYSLGMTKNPWSIIQAISTLANIIRNEKITLIHAHMFHALCIASLSKAFFLNAKLVFTSHNNGIGWSFLRKLIMSMSKALRAADVIFTKEQHPYINAKNTHVIPNGISLTLNKKNKIIKKITSRRVFLFVGRLERVKQPIMLVRAFAAMQQKNCELWLVGDGYLYSTIEQEIKNYGIEDRVHLLGIRKDVPQLLKQADCFVMASLWEGLPMAILEAGAAALPVVATPVGGIPNLLGDGCGYLTNYEDFPDTLDSIVTNYEEAQQRGNNLLRKIKKQYSLQHMSQSHIDLYNSLTNDQKQL